MCGIVGYAGPQSASHPLIEGLRRLEYRGYDSAGIALGTPGKLFIEKKAGKLSNLENALDASLPNVHSGIDSLAQEVAQQLADVVKNELG